MKHIIKPEYMHANKLEYMPQWFKLLWSNGLIQQPLVVLTVVILSLTMV